MVPRLSVFSAVIVTLAVTITLGLLGRGGVFSVEGTRSLLAVALLATLVFAAFRGGLAAGLTSAAISAAYAIWAYRRFPLTYETPTDILRRDIIIAVVFPALAFVVGYLRERVDRLMTMERRARTAAETGNKRLRDLQTMTDTALANLTSGQLLDELVARVREILAADSATIFLIADDDKTLAVAASKGTEETVPRHSRLALGQGLAGRVALERRPIAVSDVTPGDLLSRPTPQGEALRALLGVPLFVGGRVIGVLQVGNLQERAFSDDEVSFLQRVSDRAAIAIDHQHLYERAYRIAETLQRASLPETLPQLPGVDLHAAYVPGASEAGIGGDWYDAFRLPDGRLGLTIGDVTGRGLAAAVAMGQVRQSLRAAALTSSQPSTTLETASRLLRLSDTGAIATAIFGILDPVALTFTYATAGHPPPILVTSDGRAEDLPHRGAPLGMFHSGGPPDLDVTLLPGSWLVLYTDGLIERDRDAAAGHAALVGALIRAREAQSPDPARAVLEGILAERASSDDIAILIVSLAFGPVDRFNLTLPAMPASLPLARQAVRQLVTALNLGKDRSFTAEVAVGEAVSNVVEHAYRGTSGTLNVRGKVEGDIVVFEVEDQGEWRARRDEGRGRGLQFMRMLTDAVELKRTTHGTAVRLSLALNGAPSASASGAQTDAEAV